MSWTQIHAIALTNVLDALDLSGIKWLVLRNHEGLPESNRSKDVDLCLSRRDFRYAEMMITEAVRAAGFTRIIVQDFQYVRCLTYFGTQYGSPQSIKIDLLDGFVFRGAQIFEINQLYAGSRREGRFAIPSTTEDAVMLWLKPLLTGGIVKNKYIKDINDVISRDPIGFQLVLNKIFTPEWSKKVWSNIKDGNLYDTLPLQTNLRKSAWIRAFKHRPLTTLRHTGHHFISEILRRQRRIPGTFFAVLGPDGVGKSTFIEKFAEGISNLHVIDQCETQIMHFRPHLIPNIQQLFTGKPEVVANFNDPHRADQVNTLSSFLRIIYYWFDYVFGYLFKIHRSLFRGIPVLLDRYFYDFIVDPRRSRLKLPQFVAELLLFVTPKPEIVFVLDADVAKIYLRKQELPPYEIKRQLNAYRLLAKRDPDRFAILDANQTPNDIVSQALRVVIERSFPES